MLRSSLATATPTSHTSYCPSISSVLYEAPPLSERNLGLGIVSLRLPHITAAMGKKKTEDTGATMKAKSTGKDASKDGKKEKLSVSAMLASMDQNPDKPKKGLSLSAKPKVASKSSYTDGIDLPPSDDAQQESAEQKRSNYKPLDVSITDKKLKKRGKKDMHAAYICC